MTLLLLIAFVVLMVVLWELAKGPGPRIPSDAPPESRDRNRPSDEAPH